MQEHTDLVPENNNQTVTTAMQPMSFTDILDGMFTLYRHHFRLFLEIAVVYLVFAFVIDQMYAFAAFNLGMEDTLSILFYHLLGTFLLSLLVGGALIYASAHVFLKRDITAGDALKQTLQRYFSLLGSALFWALVVFSPFIVIIIVMLSGNMMLQILVFLGAFIIGIPFSIYFGVRWGLYSLPVLFEKTSATKALSRSTELVKGTWWRVFGIMVAIFLITFMISFILQTSFWAIFNSITGPTLAEKIGEEPTIWESIRILFVPTPNDIGWSAYLIRSFVTLSIAALLMPIGSIGSALLYFDMRIRKEAYDLEMQATD
ncbi:MAG: hypothetical protein OXI43_14560 [Candidatus Poribacteria bacterium]|nr:hypothetical protein [Candidatus Poribacteria bacterium]